MFLGPFEEGGDFRDAGIAGPRRFLDRLWELVDRVRAEDAGRRGDPQDAVTKWQQTVKKVTHDLETLSYNTAIAALMELLNALRDTNCSERHVVKDMIVMVAPFAPHFAEECWERLGHDTSIFDAPWPTWDERLTVEATIDLVLQVNGKTRGTIQVPRGITQDDALARAQREPSVMRQTHGKTIRKVIFVPGRLVNIVIGDS